MGATGRFRGKLGGMQGFLRLLVRDGVREGKVHLTRNMLLAVLT